jgi:predicted  nucleic acid-binding Zn-ribbon protein
VELIDQKAKLDLELQDLTAKLAALREKRDQEEPQVQQTRKDLKDLQTEIMRLNERQAALQTELKDGKNLSNELKDQLVCIEPDLLEILS